MVLSKKDIKKFNKVRLKLENNGIIVSSVPTNYILIFNGGMKNDVRKDELKHSLSNFINIIEDILSIPTENYAIICCENSNFSKEIVDRVEVLNILTPDINFRPISKGYLFYISDIPKQFTEKLTKDITSTPPGLLVYDNFLSDSEHNFLFTFVEDEARKYKSDLKQRTVIHYGYTFDYNTNGVNINEQLEKPIPEKFKNILERLNCSTKFDQCTVNIYEPGDGIPSHTDTHSKFLEEIVCVSLGGSIVMDWINPKTGENKEVELIGGGVCIMTGESRYLWRHGITSRKFDLVWRKNKDLQMDKSTEFDLVPYRQQRKKRISITFRALKIPSECINCQYPESCDVSCDKKKTTNTKQAIIMDDVAALDLERQHVYKVYEKIAYHFSDTRHSMWPRVREFVEKQIIKEGAIIGADLGCGNGKYLPAALLNSDQIIRPEFQWLYSDSCYNLCVIARQKWPELPPVIANMLLLPYRNNICDFFICIAVLHHLASRNRRITAIENSVKLLVIGGKGLIYVWARQQIRHGEKSHYVANPKNTMDQNISSKVNGDKLEVHQNRTEFKTADMLVPWTKKKKNEKDNEVYARYYHLFEEGELEELCNEISNIKIVDSWYDSGNWAVVIERTS